MSLKSEFVNKALILSENKDIVKKEDVKGAMLFYALNGSDSENDVEWVVYDLSASERLATSAVPFLCNFMSKIHESKMKFCLIASSGVRNTIESQGLSNAVSMYSSVDDFRKQTVTKKATATTEFLNILLDSVIYTMKVSLETEVKALPCVHVKSNSEIPPLQVGAIAGVISDFFNGNLLIGFEKEDFLKAMSLFLGMEVTEISDISKDGAAELLNVFIGQAKIKLNEKSFNIQQVIPSVVAGDAVSIGPMSHQTALLIPFECDFGKFFTILTTNNPKV